MSDDADREARRLVQQEFYAVEYVAAALRARDARIATLEAKRPYPGTCRPWMPHMQECGPTPDDASCACGCSADETWCFTERIAALEAQLAEARRLLQVPFPTAEELATAHADAAVLRRGLWDQGHHRAGCAAWHAGSWMHTDAERCNCGLSAALATTAGRDLLEAVRELIRAGNTAAANAIPAARDVWNQALTHPSLALVKL